MNLPSYGQKQDLRYLSECHVEAHQIPGGRFSRDHPDARTPSGLLYLQEKKGTKGLFFNHSFPIAGAQETLSGAGAHNPLVAGGVYHCSFGTIFGSAGSPL